MEAHSALITSHTSAAAPVLQAVPEFPVERQEGGRRSSAEFWWKKGVFVMREHPVWREPSKNKSAWRFEKKKKKRITAKQKLKLKLQIVISKKRNTFYILCAIIWPRFRFLPRRRRKFKSVPFSLYSSPLSVSLSTLLLSTYFLHSVVPFLYSRARTCTNLAWFGGEKKKEGDSQ